MTAKKIQTPIDRMHGAMAAAGIRTPAELARRLSLPRQTIHRWLSDGIENINYRNLLNLSDALNVNARWLIFGEVGPIKQPFEHPHESEATAIARELGNEARDQWLSLGRILVKLQYGGGRTRGKRRE